VARINKSVLRRFRVEFVLEKLLPRLRSDVLSDGTVSSACNLPVQHPIQLGGQAIVSRESLFAAFRAAADKRRPISLKDLKGRTVPAKVEIDTDGLGHVEIARGRVPVPFAGLITSKPAQRLEFAVHILRTLSLARAHEEEFLRLAGNPDFSPVDFFACSRVLTAAPEWFAGAFEAKLATTGRTGTRELIPDDIRYWDNLIAPHQTSSTLAEFIANELAAERERRLCADPIRSMQLISLAFSAPALVPLARLREIDLATFTVMVSHAVELDDHFALVGLFELCADRVAAAGVVIQLGERILKRLLEKPDWLRTAGAIFGAAFVIASAFLATHQLLGRRPVYWRRLAAAAHASLVTRACRVSDINSEELLNWAFGMVGEDYFASTFNDMAVEPQWRPDWIVPRFMFADTVGRLAAALNRIPLDQRPQEWAALIDPTYAELAETHQLFLTTYPAILEGERRQQPSLETLGALAAPVREFMADPQIDTLLMIAPIIQSHGFPEEAGDAVLKVVDSIRRNAVTLDDTAIQASLSVLAHVAVKCLNSSLGGAVARCCLDKLREVKSRNSMLDGTFRLLECSGAYADRDTGHAAFSEWVEELARVLPVDLMPDLDSLLDAITRASPELALKLGRARAIVHLGLARSRAA
jgi:hypothetical protein